MRIRSLVTAGMLLAATGCEEPKSLPQRIQESCESQFGKGTAQSQDCRIKLSIEELQKQQSSSMDAARKGV